jgi:hypothetical protein
MFYSWATFFQAQYSVFGRRNKLSARQPELITQPAACMCPDYWQASLPCHPPAAATFPPTSHHKPPRPSQPHQISHHQPSFIPTFQLPPLPKNQPSSTIFPSHYIATSTSHQSATISHLSFPLSSYLSFPSISHHQPSFLPTIQPPPLPTNQPPSAIFPSHYTSTSTAHQLASISLRSFSPSSHLHLPTSLPSSVNYPVQPACPHHPLSPYQPPVSASVTSNFPPACPPPPSYPPVPPQVTSPSYQIIPTSNLPLPITRPPSVTSLFPQD